MSTKGALTFLIPYFVAVGACYQLGYWGALEINVLQFIGIADLAKLALQPLLIGLAATVLISVVSQIIFSRTFPPGAGSHTRFGIAVRRYEPWILAGTLVAALVLGVSVPAPGNWYAVAATLGLCCVGLNRLPQVIALLPDPGVRSVLVYLVVITPLWSFADGNDAAHRVTVRRNAETVDVARSKLPLVTSSKQPVLYLGLLGETYILRETSSGQTVYVKRGEAPLFVNPRAKY